MDLFFEHSDALRLKAKILSGQIYKILTRKSVVVGGYTVI